MRRIDSFQRGSTHSRPPVKKITSDLPGSHHVLEDIPSSPHIHKLLKWMTRRGPDSKCFFERLCENLR
jgi:hypothetical protein